MLGSQEPSEIRDTGAGAGGWGLASSFPRRSLRRRERLRAGGNPARPATRSQAAMRRGAVGISGAGTSRKRSIPSGSQPRIWK